jgi:hypothetical protein
LGSDQVEVHGSTNFNTSKLAIGFHVHTNASMLVVGAMLAQNPTGKYDQPIVYASRLLNKVEHNHITTKKEALAMLYALHKFRLFYWETIFFLYRPYGSGVLGQQTTSVKKDNTMVVVILRV